MGNALSVASGVVGTYGAVLVGLYFLGFSSAGPVAGTYAASWMSALGHAGGVASSSLFSFLQSLAMGRVPRPVSFAMSVMVIGVGLRLLVQRLS